MVGFSKKLPVWAKSTIFHAFSQNEALFAERLTKTAKHDSLLENLQVLGGFLSILDYCRSYWIDLDINFEESCSVINTLFLFSERSL